MGQTLQVLGETIAMEPLDRRRDPRVQLTTTLPEHAAVRDLVRQGVLERVLDVRRRARLVEEFRSLEAAQAPRQRVVTFRDGLEQREGNRPADDRRHLEQSLVLGGQTIDA